VSRVGLALAGPKADRPKRSTPIARSTPATAKRSTTSLGTPAILTGVRADDDSLYILRKTFTFSPA
jgi:hypothetical protein